MNILNNPPWLNQFQFPYENYDEIPEHIFESINRDLDAVQSKSPLVSITITAWNEEKNILSCIASLSKMRTSTAFEIILVNNNSTDQTQKILDRLHVKTLFQPVQGCGPSRQFAQENASGKYILTADADCIYPDCWIDEMLKALTKPGIVCVYGRYSFIGEPGYPRWKLTFYELMKDIIAEYRSINRPYLNAYGMSMGYIKELGLKEGIIQANLRGYDGRLCYSLMKYGKVKQVRSAKARVWTPPRTLKLDGTIFQAFVNRFRKEMNRFFYNLHSQPPEPNK